MDLFKFGAETLARLDKIVALLSRLVSLSEEEARLRTPSVKSESSLVKTKPRGVNEEVFRAKAPTPLAKDSKNRVSEAMFQTKAPLLLQELLNGHVVGKLVKSISGSLACSDDTIVRIARRLEKETTFITIVKGGRGGMMVRLTDTKAAQRWLSDLENSG